MTNNQIINGLNEYFFEIIQKLASKEWQHFNAYFAITQKFAKGDLDEGFRKIFCNFYIMNGPMGLNNQQQEVFFNLLSEKADNLEKILKILYEIPGYGNRKKIFLSFATKMIHTIDNNVPIYDRNIANILGLLNQKNQGSFWEKIENRLEIFKELKNRYNELLSNNEIKNILKKFRDNLQQKAENEGFLWQNEILSDVKLLDSLLWSFYIIHQNVQHEPRKE